MEGNFEHGSGAAHRPYTDKCVKCKQAATGAPVTVQDYRGNQESDA